MPGPTFGFVKLLASSGSHCTKWADEQHRQAGFESRLLPDLPLPFIPTLIGLRAFDLVSSRVWWEAATNTTTNTTARSWRAFSCVLWWGALDRLWLRAARFGRVCSTTGYITSGLRGPSPQALTLFGGVGFIARRLRRPEKGNADGVRGIFWTAYRVGLRPCDRTHLKHGLVPYSYVGGT